MNRAHTACGSLCGHRISEKGAKNTQQEKRVSSISGIGKNWDIHMQKNGWALILHCMQNNSKQIKYLNIRPKNHKTPKENTVEKFP